MRRWVVVLRRILTDRNISDQKISETVSLVVNFLRFLVVKKVFELRSFSFLLGKKKRNYSQGIYDTLDPN